jgi:hypothetical protein
LQVEQGTVTPRVFPTGIVNEVAKVDFLENLLFQRTANLHGLKQVD